MAVYREDILDVELESGTVNRSFLCHSIGEGDNAANRYGIRAFRNGSPVPLTGISCQGYFIRHKTAETVVIADGAIDGNVAYVTLPQACYAVEGDFSLAIKLVGGGVTGTMRIIDGVVSNTTTETLIDPGHVIPSIQELIALIEQMEDAIEAVNALGLYVDAQGYTCQRLVNE